ncbi:MAG: NADH-quinone oxidoreductase subunit L, partial [Actinobacteria bacterium]|nr:NADH-quinone oxidoreductase subunit L [Actinomycetota bacterium]
YFLISFWHTRDSAAVAGKKAFVTNRIGDFGVMTAMFLAFSAVGTLSYSGIKEAAHHGSLAPVTATAIAMLLFVGACGKSAQLPLYLWLPDAMEGPTPVSALIHAATMVTSGVFLMTRMSPVLHESYSWAPMVIACIGAATALYAATVAVAQNDIKKVLAYSTVSQLGFMFLAIGSGAYVAAIFHMITHAFFKALLFLGSGSVIHGMHHEQDMRRMGALRKVMPVTAITFIVGWLAIAGVPPFAGFWSKDEILLYVYANNRGLYVVGVITALLTAYYMTRQVIMVFYGEAKWNDHAAENGAHGDFTPHESPRIMLMPLVVLAGLAMVGGALQLPFSKKTAFLEHWLAPVVEESEAHIHETWAYQNKYLLLGVAVVVAVLGIVAAFAVYAKHKIKAIEPKILEQAWNYDATAARLVGGPFCSRIRGHYRGRCCCALGVVCVERACLMFASVEKAGVATASFPILTMLVLMPLFGAILVSLLSKKHGEWVKLAALVSSIATGAMSVWMLVKFPTGAAGFEFVSKHSWISEWGISWHLGVDGISLFMVVLTGMLFPLVIVGIDPHHDHKSYLAWMLLLEAGVMGSFLSLDLFLFFVFFEIVLVPMYFL